MTESGAKTDFMKAPDKVGGRGARNRKEGSRAELIIFSVPKEDT